MQCLEVLELKDTGVHSAGLGPLVGLKGLRGLDLGPRFELDDQGVEYLAGEAGGIFGSRGKCCGYLVHTCCCVRHVFCVYGIAGRTL